MSGVHSGSSPRMRGTPCQQAPHSGRDGIIPAHAGNASNRSGAGAHTRDHPRACGEHAYSPDGTRGCGGSSPRMRGTLWVSSVGLSPVRDHPRACGEHRQYGREPLPCQGSSPRMRGTRSGRHRRPDRRGIIPAHAGNTFGHRTAPTVHGDHPRACGEHHITVQTVMPESGSSPRMRGTRIADDIARVAAGIIPAHAGNTRPPPRRWRRWRDHPRACGEHRAE